MTWIKFYDKEREEFPLEAELTVSDKDCVKICKKIARHFKFHLGEIRFYGRNGYHNCEAYDDGSIRFVHNPSILHICHELAHIHNLQKYGNWRHNKKLLRTIKRFVNYCRKKNYWNMVTKR